MFGLNPYIILGVIVIMCGVYVKGRADGADNCKYKTIVETLADQEKLDEIRENRTDGNGVSKRLRSGTF